MKVLSFYHFEERSEAQLKDLQAELKNAAQLNDSKGLIILAPEGCNVTMSGGEEALTELYQIFQKHFSLGSVILKESEASDPVFRRFVVKIKKEIVTTGDPTLRVAGEHRALSPTEWHETLQNDPNVVVLDTRNTYEVEIGKFRRALDPQIETFVDFPKRLRELGIEKDKRLLIYCTGGIRCEKAIVAMEREGYKNVFQLKGGILKYIEQFPNGEFDGECFVFDDRVAVDQTLRPTTRYTLCPLCGSPAEEVVSCARCEVEAKLCTGCIASGEKACSLNCRNLLQREIQ